MFSNRFFKICKSDVFLSQRLYFKFKGARFSMLCSTIDNQHKKNFKNSKCDAESGLFVRHCQTFAVPKKNADSPTQISLVREILKKFEPYSNIVIDTVLKPAMLCDNVDVLLNKEWESLANADLARTFENLACLALNNNTKEQLANEKYQGIVMEITKRAPQFTNTEIFLIMKCLEFFETDKFNEIYRAMWKAIDKELVKRFAEGPKESTTEYLDKVFYINDQIFKLGWMHQADFTYYSLRKVGKRIKFFKPRHLVHLSFIMNVLSKVPFNKYDVEYYFEKQFDDLNIEEIGVIAMGLIRQSSSIKSNELVMKILKKLTQELDTVSDISLTNICKVIRVSVDLSILDPFQDFLRKCSSQVAKRNHLTMTHVLQVQTKVLMEDKDFTLAVIKKFEAEKNLLRLKDLERIILTLFTFDYDPKECLFYSVVEDELLSPARESELEEYKKPLINCIMYMVEAGYFPWKLLRKVLNPDFINKYCCNNIHQLERDYLVIDTSIGIEHPEYDGPRLRPDISKLLIKRFGSGCNWFVKKTLKSNQGETLLNDIVHITKEVVGSQDSVYLDPLCPHFIHTMVVTGFDQNNKIVSPEEIKNTTPGTIKYAPKDGNKWIATMLGTHNLIIRDTYQYGGLLSFHLRQLKLIGYIPKVIPFYEWHKLKNVDEKKNYITNHLYS